MSMQYVSIDPQDTIVTYIVCILNRAQKFLIELFAD